MSAGALWCDESEKLVFELEVNAEWRYLLSW